MKLIMKNLSSIAVAICLAFGLTAGCGGSSGNANGNANNGSADNVDVIELNNPILSKINSYKAEEKSELAALERDELPESQLNRATIIA